jgi:hypothetical protein
VNDTTPEAQERLTALYAAMSPSEKLERIRQLTLAANRLALSGLRERYPDEAEGELLLRLARRRLGDELVAEVYGPLPSDA